MKIIVILLAYLWGANGIPWRCPSSIGCHPSSVIHFVSSVSTITTKNNQDIKSIFSANVYHVPVLPLPGIGGTPYISHMAQIMARKPYFHIFDFFETTSRCRFILCQKSAET